MKTITKMAMAAGCMACCALGAWELPPCSGDVKNNWKPATGNWTWQAGNPMKMEGGSWLVFVQDKENAPLSDKFVPMAPGIAWKFNRVWRDTVKEKTDPLFFYKDHQLIAPVRLGYGKGKPVGIAFTPQKAGAFDVAISGKASAGNPSAGNALVQIFLYSPADESASLLQEYELNKPGGYGKLPEEFAFKRTLNLEAGAVLAVRLLAVNPGPASSGKATLTFKEFKVEPK